MRGEQSSLHVFCCLLFVGTPPPLQRSERLRCFVSEGSSVAGRLERPEELLEICSIDGELGLMRSLAVAAGNDAGRLSWEESDSGVSLRDEARDDELGDLHSCTMPKSLLLYCGRDSGGTDIAASSTRDPAEAFPFE